MGAAGAFRRNGREGCIGGATLLAADRRVVRRDRRGADRRRSWRRELPAQPGPCRCPFALDRRWRNVECFGCLFDAQAAEVTQLDESRLTSIEPSELAE